MLGVMGAVVGGTFAAIDNIQKVAKGEQKSDEAIANVAKESLGTGLSTATATAVMASLGIGGGGRSGRFCSRCHCFERPSGLRTFLPQGKIG